MIMSERTPDLAIETSGLVKVFGKTRAVDQRKIWPLQEVNRCSSSGLGRRPAAKEDDSAEAAAR